jgi:hypothetical protein
MLKVGIKVAFDNLSIDDLSQADIWFGERIKGRNVHI